MQIGIRAHDVAGDTLEEAFSNIEKQGFVCAHLAMTKSVKSFKVTPETETPGLAKYVKHLAEKHGLDIAVLGNYNNLCNPDPQQLKSIQYTYTAALRFGAGARSRFRSPRRRPDRPPGPHCSPPRRCRPRPR